MRLVTRSAIAMGSAVLMIVTAGAVWGDTVRNHADETVDAIAEVVGVTDGESVSVGLSVVATSDSKKGCNIDSSLGQVLVVNATSQKPNVALVSNSNGGFVSTTKLTFTNCGTTVNLWVQGADPGVGTVAFSIDAVETTAGGTFKMNAATFQVRVTAL